MTETHGSLETLARRGHQRGASTVLAGARHDARHHQRQRAVAVGATAVTLLAGTVGAGVLLLHHDPPPVTAASASLGTPAAPGAPGQVDGSLITGVRLVGHDGYDRIEIDYDGAVPPSPHPEGAAPPPTGPECATPADLEHDGIYTEALPSGAAATPDGLVAGLSGQRISGDATIVREVVPLCAQNGYTYFAVVIDDADLMSIQSITVPDGTDPEDIPPPDFTGSLGTGQCVLDDPDQVQIDFYTWLDSARTQPSSAEVCPEMPA
jgi:hypothetical protein